MPMQLMGVVNITPDSFSDGAGTIHWQNISEKLDWFTRWQADFLDLGAESTAPSSQAISTEEELQRWKDFFNFFQTLNVNLRQAILGKKISIDTYRIETIRYVAEQFLALNSKTHLVWNDVSGKVEDDEFAAFWDWKKAKKARIDYIYCHNLAPTRHTSSLHHQYLFTGTEIVPHLEDYFARGLKYLSSLPIDQVFLDPSFGFSKKLSDNWDILRTLAHPTHKHPIILGLSRKKFLREKMRQQIPLAQEKELFAASEFLELALLMKYFSGHGAKNHQFILRTHTPFTAQSLAVLELV